MRDIWGAPGSRIPHRLLSQPQIWPNLCASYHTLLALCLAASCHPLKCSAIVACPRQPNGNSYFTPGESFLKHILGFQPRLPPRPKPYRHTPCGELGCLPTPLPRFYVPTLQSPPYRPTTNQPDFSLLSRTDHLNLLCSPLAWIRLIPAPRCLRLSFVPPQSSPYYRHPSAALLGAFSFLRGHCTPSPHTASSDLSGPHFLRGGHRVCCFSGQ